MSKNGITLEAAAAAAGWWASKVAAPKFDNLGPTRGRDARETEVNTFASIMAMKIADANAPSEEQIDSFKRALTNLVFAGQPAGLHVDYHPDVLLSRAASEAGISDSRFPWKSHTWFTADGRVEASYGYGAPTATIFTPEEGADVQP